MRDLKALLKPLSEREMPDRWTEIERRRARPPGEPPHSSRFGAYVVSLLTVLVVGVLVARLLPLGRDETTPGSTGGTPADTQTPASPTGSFTPGSSVSEALLSRPLALPSVREGSACPTTPATTIKPGPGTGFHGATDAQQAGRVYLAQSDGTVTISSKDRTPDGWYGIKDIWVIDGSYEGPLLIRGGRVDGAGPLEMAWNPTTPMQEDLQLDPSSPSFQENPATGWRSAPMAAYVRSPGCYAYQLDGIGFTRFIVFEVSS